MREVSQIRLLVLRGFYLLILLGVGSRALPALFLTPAPLDPLDAVAYSFWAALALLAGLGIRYPLQMLPILLIQLLYKSLWIAAVAIPAWLDGRTPATELTMVMLVGAFADLVIIPWRHVYAHYLRKPAESWSFRRPAIDRSPG